MGELFRPFCLPAMLPDEIPHADCPPVLFPSHARQVKSSMRSQILFPGPTHRSQAINSKRPDPDLCWHRFMSDEVDGQWIVRVKPGIAIGSFVAYREGLAQFLLIAHVE